MVGGNQHVGAKGGGVTEQLDLSRRLNVGGEEHRVPAVAELQDQAGIV